MKREEPKPFDSTLRVSLRVNLMKMGLAPSEVLSAESRGVVRERR